MCQDCGARALTPARQALIEAEHRMRREARLARLRDLPGYRREIHTSERGVTLAGVMRLQAMPGVTIDHRREDGIFKYRITLADPDAYDAVMAEIEASRPPAARAEAARVRGARPANRAARSLV